MNQEHAAHGEPGPEQMLAAALGALVQQVDVAEYRDGLGRPLKNNVAYLHAQAIVDQFGVTHEDICRVLATCDDVGEAAKRLSPRGRQEAEPGDRPPEYRTWTTGP